MTEFIVHSGRHDEPRRDLKYTDMDEDTWVHDGAGWHYLRKSDGLPATMKRRLWGQTEDGPFAFPWRTTLPDGDTRQWQYEMEDSGFVVKDSGQREEYDNGFVRDTEDGKPDYTRLFADPAIHAAVNRNPDLLDFLATPGAALVPVEMLIRWAEHMHKGAQKYGEDNWRQARGTVAIARFTRSFCRHAVQWLRGDRDEDHAAAIMFNVSARELTPRDEEGAGQ